MNHDLCRILDANLNRAGEALRVLEEHARMVLGDVGLSERAKSLRHDLAAARALLPARDLLAARDVEHDVGTSLVTAGEQTRADPAAVAAAAGRRGAEALRCLEEYGKVVDPAFAARIERIRYALYTLEQDICLNGPLLARFRAARIHVLITEALCAGPWEQVARAVMAGGADVVQLREKAMPDAALLDRARQLRDWTRAAGVLLCINDRPDLARLVGADVVHVGQDDLPVAAARSIAGAGVLVGKSTHDVAQFRAALAERPDYLAVGPMFASMTKPESGVRGPSLLAEALRLTGQPIVAIGGISMQTVGQLPVTPQVQIAVCQSVIAAADPAAAVGAMKAAMAATNRE